MTEGEQKRRILIGVIGVTGAPGSGKSAAAASLGRLGARVVALDEIGHELLKSEHVREQIRDTFSAGVFRIMDGEVSREKLGKLVFSDAEELRKLNRILHPPMVERVKRDVGAWRESEDAAPAFVIEGALLIEMGASELCDRVVLVRAPREVRLRRLERARDWKDDELARREDAQLDDEARAARAGIVLDNDSTLDELDRKVKALWEEWT